MGIFWIGLSAFGFIFDPEHTLVVISLIVFGCLQILLYFWLRQKPVLEISGNVLVYHQGIFFKSEIQIDRVLGFERNAGNIILHMKDDKEVAIRCSAVESQALPVFLDTLQDKIKKT